MSEEIFAAKVHFVAGKGGVGKTLIAQAFAHFFSQRKKTLLIEISEEEANSKQLASIKKLSPNLFHCRLFPDQTLYEYLTLKIPQKMVLDSLMSQTLFRALGAAMPGLADLTRLGKIWFHADAEHEPKGEIFEKIVVDMPSSGFVGRFLTIARVVSDAVKIGPLAKEAKLIHDYFAKAGHARLHVVTLPQELVVNETIELINEIKDASSMHLGFIVLNRVFPEVIGPNLHSIYFGAEITKVLQFFYARIEAEALEKMRLKKSGIPEISFPDFVGEKNEDIIVQQLAAIIAHGENR